MKKNELKNLKRKSIDDLQKELFNERERLRVLLFDLASGKVKNSAAVMTKRRDIARIFTIIKEKEANKS